MTLYQNDKIELVHKIDRNDIIPIPRTILFDKYVTFISRGLKTNKNFLNESLPENIELKNYELFGLSKKICETLKENGENTIIIGRDIQFSYWSEYYDFDYYVALVRPIINEMFIHKFLKQSVERISW